MPYITKKDREEIDPVLESVVNFISDEKLLANPGPLNYIITKLCHAYVQLNGFYNYAGLNEIIGILECSKQEFYRMVVAKYEDKKRIENGSISEIDARNLEDVR